MGDCPRTQYELESRGGQQPFILFEFIGPRKLALEESYQKHNESRIIHGESGISRRAWYDANVWSVHKDHMKNPFVEKGTRQRAGLP